MRWAYTAAYVVAVTLALLGWGTTMVVALESAVDHGTSAVFRGEREWWQVPDLLRSIVEAVQRALRELEDSLRDQVCGRCPAMASALVLASVLVVGYDRRRRD